MQVIAVSTDTHFSHWMWKKTSPTIKDVHFPMVSDPSGAVSRDTVHGSRKAASIDAHGSSSTQMASSRVLKS